LQGNYLDAAGFPHIPKREVTLDFIFIPGKSALSPAACSAFLASFTEDRYPIRRISKT